jgi:MSHA biogenesis protein MshK
MRDWLTAAALAVAAGLSLGPAGAQALRDPTQPPLVVAPPAPGTTDQPVSGEPQLQSVLISNRANGRRVAVIDGETVRVGDKVRDAIVVRINQKEVILRQGKVEQKLVMATPSTARAPVPKAEAVNADTNKAEPPKAARSQLEELLIPKARAQ